MRGAASFMISPHVTAGQGRLLPSLRTAVDGSSGLQFSACSRRTAYSGLFLFPLLLLTPHRLHPPRLLNMSWNQSGFGIGSFFDRGALKLLWLNWLDLGNKVSTRNNRKTNMRFRSDLFSGKRLGFVFRVRGFEMK